MTVKELIEELKKYPEDLEVRFDYCADVDIRINDEFYDGDYANPDCPVITCLMIN